MSKPDVLIHEMATGNPASLMHLTLLRPCCLSAKLLNANFLARCPSSAALSPPAPGTDEASCQQAAALEPTQCG